MKVIVHRRAPAEVAVFGLHDGVQVEIGIGEGGSEEGGGVAVGEEEVGLGALVVAGGDAHGIGAVEEEHELRLEFWNQISSSRSPRARTSSQRQDLRRSLGPGSAPSQRRWTYNRARSRASVNPGGAPCGQRARW